MALKYKIRRMRSLWYYALTFLLPLVAFATVSVAIFIFSRWISVNTNVSLDSEAIYEISGLVIAISGVMISITVVAVGAITWMQYNSSQERLKNDELKITTLEAKIASFEQDYDKPSEIRKSIINTVDEKLLALETKYSPVTELKAEISDIVKLIVFEKLFHAAMSKDLSLFTNAVDSEVEKRMDKLAKRNAPRAEKPSSPGPKPKA